jgi:hypothetical protein
VGVWIVTNCIVSHSRSSLSSLLSNYYYYSDNLHNLDDQILNPAIAQIMGVIVNAQGGASDMLKPFVDNIFKPLGLIKAQAESAANATVNITKKKSDPEITSTTKRVTA